MFTTVGATRLTTAAIVREYESRSSPSPRFSLLDCRADASPAVVSLVTSFHPLVLVLVLMLVLVLVLVIVIDSLSAIVGDFRSRAGARARLRIKARPCHQGNVSPI
jgi:hypothetical protein